MYNNYYDMQRNNTYTPQQPYPPTVISDYGPNPFVADIRKATLHNNTFRTALWTGNHLQLTLMSIPVGEDIGLEIHPNVDQFLRIEDGQGLVQTAKAVFYLCAAQPPLGNATKDKSRSGRDQIGIFRHHNMP